MSTFDRTSANDDLIRAALADGRIAADPATGRVWLLGELVKSGGQNYVRLKLGTHSLAAHRIVWIAAHGSIPPGFFINHRNKARADNRLSNLETVTPAQNVQHGYDSYWTQPFIRAEDLTEVAEVRPDWLARVALAAADPNTTAEQIAELRAETRGESPTVRGIRTGSLARRMNC